MRAGRLRHKAQIITLGHDLRKTCHGTVWCDITAKDGAAPPMPAGLRTGARVGVRARYTDRLRQGVYLITHDRILHVTSVRDVTGKRAELVASCDEFVGQPAEYVGQTGRRRCMVHITHNAPYLDELGQVTSYQHKAEVLVLEVGRPQPGDKIIMADGSAYTVTQYASDTDDGVVRGLWLESEGR